jgi:hypothetical protein
MKKIISISLIISLIFIFFLRLFFFKNHKIKDYLESSCHFKTCDSCEINLTNIVNEKIDYIFIFYPEASKYEISKAIGFNYENDSEISDERRRVIVTHNKHILLEEEYWNNELGFQGGYFVEFSNNKRLKNPYDRFENSIFMVKKFKDDYYLLKQ